MMNAQFTYLLAACNIAAVALATTPIGSMFEGCYHDPNHPNGYRAVKMHDQYYQEFRMGECDGSDVDQVTQAYANPAEAWRDDEGDKISIDFRPKGGPSWMIGVWNATARGISWEDGNLWEMHDEGCASSESHLIW